MGFSSLNDYLTKVTNSNQIGNIVWQKMLGAVGAFTAGRWYDMAYHLGQPMLQRPGERLLNGQLMGSATNWTLNGNWTFVAPNLLHHATGSALTAVATSIGGAGAGIENGPRYALSYWLSTNTTAGGGVTPSVGGVNFTNRSATGQFEEIVTSGATTDFTITPPAGTWVGDLQNFSLLRLLRGVPLYDTDMGAMYHGGNVSTATKHLLFSGIVSAAANFVPGTWMLVDVLKAYPVGMDTLNAQTLDDYEHAVNGAFASNATWVWGAAWHWNAGGFADKDTDGVTTLAETSVPAAAAGKVYAVTFTVPAVTVAGGLTVGFGGATDSTLTSLTAGTTYTLFITATGAGDLIFTPTVANSRFTIDNVSVTLALPRYSNGAGVRAMVVWNSGSWQATAGTSAVAHNYGAFTYTNSAGTGSRNLPITVAGVSGAVPVMSHIDHSGVAANNIGPFLPLASGDAGIRSVQTFQLTASSGANNYATVLLCKPLAVMPNTTASVATERDFMNQIRNLPQIVDGANLHWLFMPGAATAISTSVYGWMDYVWG